MDDPTQTPPGHPLLDEFAGMVKALSTDGIASFTDLTSEPFMVYWKNLIIYRHEPEIADFRIVFFGTEVAASYGEDWTGRLLSQSGFEKGYESIYQINLEIMQNHRHVSDSGSLDWQDRGYKKWHEVKMPLRRNGEINEVLVYMCFD